jgi:hypothetical protein
MYGLIKIHKVGNPIRPIISSVKTFNYNLSKSLVPFLSHLTVNEFTVKNSHSFVEEIKQLEQNCPVFMASFDVVSLFTNVPLDETYNIAFEELYNPVGNLPFDRMIVSQFFLLDTMLRRVSIT